jgi:hypothetical protein
MARYLAAYEKNFKGWQTSDQTSVTINGAKFIRKSWKGISNEFNKEIRGITHIAFLDGQLVSLTVQDIDPYFDTIAVGEASLMTFK